MFVRLTFEKNPGLKTRRIALPVLSGPRLKRKHAGAPNSLQSVTRFGTPNRVPRSVSTSTFNARRTAIRSDEGIILVRQMIIQRQPNCGTEIMDWLPAELRMDRFD